MYYHPKPAASHAEADHVWPYLDVRSEVIRQAFEVAI